MARGKSKTEACTSRQAKQRQAQAASFIDVAELAAHEYDPDIEYGGVAAALAVLAGIAASDAACCHMLGERSRSQDHRDAEALLAEIKPGGDRAVKNLRGLLNLKDTARYGMVSVSGAQLKRSMRQAQQLIEFADQILRR